LGPASLNDTFLNFCAIQGSCHFRLNAAHLEPDRLEYYIKEVNSRIRDQEKHFYLDLTGRKIRIGQLPEDMVLVSGEIRELIPATASQGMVIPIPSKNFFHFISEGDILWLQDGTIQLEVMKSALSGIKVKVDTGGRLRSRAGLLIKDRLYPVQEQMKDLWPYLEIARRFRIGSLALSYVSGARDLKDLRSNTVQMGYQPEIAAKIEHPAALKELEEIIEEADIICYCRGDMGTFISSRELADWQDRTIELSVKMKKPVFIAGQVFQYLVNHPQPSRSEVVHFYHLLKQHVSGVVLSDETAIGAYPLESVKEVTCLLSEKSIG
jgi:pyruvate kinase